MISGVNNFNDFLRINLPNFVQFIDAGCCEKSSIDWITFLLGVKLDSAIREGSKCRRVGMHTK